jgi:hypothetical protein
MRRINPGDIIDIQPVHLAKSLCIDHVLSNGLIMKAWAEEVET